MIEIIEKEILDKWKKKNQKATPSQIKSIKKQIKEQTRNLREHLEE